MLGNVEGLRSIGYGGVLPSNGKDLDEEKWLRIGEKNIVCRL